MEIFHGDPQKTNFYPDEVWIRMPLLNKNLFYWKKRATIGIGLSSSRTNSAGIGTLDKFQVAEVSQGRSLHLSG
jgi:hypothetical protein